MPRVKKPSLDEFFDSKEKPAPKKKIRKLRAPMSEEQRAAAAERLRKAREKRLKENPPQYKNVHSSVLNRLDTDPLNFVNVKDWIAQSKIRLREAKANRKADKYGEAKVNSIIGYISLLEAYLRTGDWYAMYCGENEDQLVQTRCVAQAFHSDGTPKRTVGVFYPEIGDFWTKEMDEEHRNFLDL